MNEFTNNPIDITQLPKFEEVQLKGLNPKYITVLLFNFSLLLILVIGGFSALFYFKQEAFSNTIWMGIVVGIVLFSNSVDRYSYLSTISINSKSLNSITFALDTIYPFILNYFNRV